MRNLLFVIIVFFVGCGATEESVHVSRESGNLILTPSHGGDVSAWGYAECESCHLMSIIHDGASNIRQMVKDKGFNSCMGCHGNNGTGEKQPCIICHNRVDMPHYPYQLGEHSHNFVTGATGNITDEDCLVCHDASDMNGTFDLARDLTLLGGLMPYQREADFCLRCHNRNNQQTGYEMNGLAFDDPLIAMEDNYTHTDYHGFLTSSGTGTYAGLRSGYSYDNTTIACSDCHSLHGTDNGALIIDNSVDGVKNLDSDLRGGSFTVNSVNGDFSQLCALCHAMEVIIDSGDVDSGNGLSGVHEVGMDCRPCHTHGEATQTGL